MSNLSEYFDKEKAVLEAAAIKEATSIKVEAEDFCERDAAIELGGTSTEHHDETTSSEIKEDDKKLPDVDIPRPFEGIGSDPWYRQNKETVTRVRGGISFKGFLTPPQQEHLPSYSSTLGMYTPRFDVDGHNKRVEIYNNRVDFIMDNLTGGSIKLLSSTTMMSSKEEIKKYVALINALLDEGIFD